MYASNEDEDWIYLHETPPINTVVLIDHEQSNSLSSSSNSSSSESDRSISMSSISSIELEHVKTDDLTLNSDVSLSPINNSIDHHDLEQDNHLLEMTNIDDSLLFSHDNISQIENDNNLCSSQQMISTPAVQKKESFPPEMMFLNENPTIETNTTNESDVLNTGFEFSKTFSLRNDLRRRPGLNVQEVDLSNSEVMQSTPISQDDKSRKSFERHQNKHDTLVSCTCMIVLLILPFIFGQIVTQWDQSTMNIIAKELVKTNQRLDEIKNIPIGNFEEKLTKQFEHKIQKMINQQLTWYEHEKSGFISRIDQLQEILNKTQKNMTNTIHQLTNENERLQEQINLLERRLEERYPKDKNSCLKGVNCTKSSRLTLNKLVTNLFKRTASIATDTSVNLSGLFEHLSASVSDIVDHRHEYMKESKRKLTDFSGSSTAEKVQRSFRRSVENLSSSFRKAKLTYATWIKSRAQTRMKNNQIIQEQTTKKFPWRWTFTRNYNREYISSQTTTKEHVCYSKFSFPINKMCSMKNWMVKLFQP